MGRLETYSVTLDEEEVSKAKIRCIRYGGKLSPLLNEFLKEFNKKEKISEEKR